LAEFGHLLRQPQSGEGGHGDQRPLAVLQPRPPSASRLAAISWSTRALTVFRDALRSIGKGEPLIEVETRLDDAAKYGIRPGDEVLDIGCGTGLTTREASRAAAPTRANTAST